MISTIKRIILLRCFFRLRLSFRISFSPEPFLPEDFFLGLTSSSS